MTTIRTIQYRDGAGEARVGLVEGSVIHAIDGAATLYGVAQGALAAGRGLAETILAAVGGEREDYDALERENRLLPPVNHPSSDANFLITGTGLTHMGSASTRNAMHHNVDPEDPPKSDSIRLYELGLAGGKTGVGEIGAMPEWFYKGDGSCLVSPGQAMWSPNFALSCAEEPEITGIYLVGPDGTPWRLGFTLSNDLSDHETERQNFMYVAPSKIRDCSMGPELVIGSLPDEVDGTSRILRDGEVAWEGLFESGEARMSYSIANLEHHHFRYRAFQRPGDLHAHLFGCPIMSFGDGFRTRTGDVFEFDVPAFGRPLRNPVVLEEGTPEAFAVRQL